MTARLRKVGRRRGVLARWKPWCPSCGWVGRTSSRTEAIVRCTAHVCEKEKP